MELTNEQIDQILTGAIYEFVFEADSPAPKEDEAPEGYVQVQIPFSGLYNGYWSYRLETYEEVMQDNIADEAYERDGMKTRDLYNRIKDSKAWKEFIANEEKLQKVLDGTHVVNFDVPVSIAEIADSSCKALESLFDTYAGELIGAKNVEVKLAGVWSPKEYNFMSDHLYAYIPEKMWEAICRPEVFEHEAYKAWASYWSKSHDGYIPFHDYETFFDTEEPICRQAVMLFWSAQMISAHNHFVAFSLTDKIDEGMSEKACGMSEGAIGYELDVLGSEEDEPDWKFEECNYYSLDKAKFDETATAN